MVLSAVALISIRLGTLLDDQQTCGGVMVNLGTEIAGAVVMYFAFERVVERSARKKQLIGDMCSNVRDVAVHAANELRRNGWLTD